LGGLLLFLFPVGQSVLEVFVVWGKFGWVWDVDFAAASGANVSL